MNISIANELNLKISIEPSQPYVKVYDLVPDLGKIRGYGVNKENRSALIDVLDRLQLSRQDGIYLLFNQMIINYVGMTQNIENRLNTHNSKKKGDVGWDRVIVFYAKTPVMNGNIAGFAEHTLYLHLKQIGFYLYQKPPTSRFLNDEDSIVTALIVSEIKRILDLLDLSKPISYVQFMNTRSISQAKDEAEIEVQNDVAALESFTATDYGVIEVELTERGANALGRYTGYGLEVFAGSIGKASLQEHMKKNRKFLAMRQELLAHGVISIDENDILRFEQSFTFSSPTAAAQMLCGSNAPGPLVWKRVSDKTPLVKVKQDQ